MRDHTMPIVLDLRGGGVATSHPVPTSSSRWPTTPKGLLDVFGIERADVIGYSMGGRIALSLALDLSTRVRRLVLAATSARTRSPASSVACGRLTRC